jgi:hypothetical protein
MWWPEEFLMIGRLSPTWPHWQSAPKILIWISLLPYLHYFPKKKNVKKHKLWDKFL